MLFNIALHSYRQLLNSNQLFKLWNFDGLIDDS